MSNFPFFDPTRPPPAFPFQLNLVLPDDQSIVNDFLSNKLQHESTVTPAHPTTPSISQLRTKLVTLINEVESLKTKKEALEKEIESQPDSQWQTTLMQLEQLQATISTKLAELSDPALQSEMGKKLHQRRKKRAWLKRRNARLKQQKQQRSLDRAKLHEQIDHWLQEQHKLLEQEKQALQQLDNASKFLADVHRQKATCKRYLTKFEKIRERQKLRDEDNENDDKAKLDELTKTWKAKLADCIKEEKHLKDVLARRSTANYERRVRNEWNRTLFGDVIPKKFEHPLLVAERDRGALIEVRTAWDVCLVEGAEDDDGEASAIPLGWVLPPVNPSAEWAKYRVKE